jgi:quinol monooxygenase YgiN
LRLTITAVLADCPNVFVFELYADVDAYESHLETVHFKKYNATTQDMVKSLKVRDRTYPARRAKPM